MEAEFVELWEVSGERDRTEGRGGMYVVGYAQDFAAAERLSEDRGVMGAPGVVRAVRAVRFADGSTYVLGARCDDAWRAAEARARALAKLTAEERALLGLGEP